MNGTIYRIGAASANIHTVAVPAGTTQFSAMSVATGVSNITHELVQLDALNVWNNVDANDNTPNLLLDALNVWNNVDANDNMPMRITAKPKRFNFIGDLSTAFSKRENLTEDKGDETFQHLTWTSCSLQVHKILVVVRIEHPGHKASIVIGRDPHPQNDKSAKVIE